MISVDVVIVVHNHALTLAATLSGLSEQSSPVRRVLLVDNASEDGSAEIAADWQERLPLEVVRRAENGGFSVAFNEGLRRSTAPWVLSLNPDCRLSPDYLAALLSAAEQRDNVGALSGLLMRAAGPQLMATDTVDSAGMVVAASGRHLDRGSGGRLRACLQKPALVFGASGAAALYRRSALDDVAYPGGEVFDERFFAYREDADLAWRLLRRGWSCLYWPAARAFHARGLKPEFQRRGTTEINRLSVRNRFLLRLSNADWRWHVACFPCWLVRDVVVLLACATVERESWMGLREAWSYRHHQRLRGSANRRRAVVSGWSVARWFLPGGSVRAVSF